MGEPGSILYAGDESTAHRPIIERLNGFEQGGSLVGPPAEKDDEALYKRRSPNILFLAPALMKGGDLKGGRPESDGACTLSGL